MTKPLSSKIVVVGLGYVGLPLAVALARQFTVLGLDLNRQRISELEAGHDRTDEIEDAVLKGSNLAYTCDPEQCRSADVYIVTVPTPVDKDNVPDLSALRSASKTIGGLLDAEKRCIVVFESTVYPGVTEDICGPIIAEESGLECGKDFFLGYSPERINPGDREHTIDKITKVVAGQTPEVLAQLSEIYGTITRGGVHQAASIKVAEAAKVIENAQRDLNIAFMNEITRIFSLLNISIWDVLAAAGTKWNFLPFTPGLVGGHCIGVDPYYLSFRAKELGYEPQVILAGRSTNDGMGAWIADMVHRQAGTPGRALILGITFKENVPDLRNSRVIDVITRLRDLGWVITVHDPLADNEEARHEYGIDLDRDAFSRSYDAVIAAVAHTEYRNLGAEDIDRLVKPGGCLADLKGIWRMLTLGTEVNRWSL